MERWAKATLVIGGSVLITVITIGLSWFTLIDLCGEAGELPGSLIMIATPVANAINVGFYMGGKYDHEKQ